MEGDTVIDDVSDDNFIQVVNPSTSSGFSALNIGSANDQQALLQVLSAVAAAVKTEHTNKQVSDGDLVGVSLSGSDDSSQVTVYNANSDVAVFRKNELDHSASQEVCFNLQCDAFASETVVATSEYVEPPLDPVLDPVLIYPTINRKGIQQAADGSVRPLFLPVHIGPQQKPEVKSGDGVCDVMFLTSIKDIVLHRIKTERPDSVFWIGKPAEQPCLSDPKLMCVTDRETRIQFYFAIERTCIKRFTMGNDVLFYITISFNEFIYINLLQTLYELKYFGKILPLGRKDNGCNIRLLTEATDNDSLEQDAFLQHLKRIPNKEAPCAAQKSIGRLKNTARKSMHSGANIPFKPGLAANPPTVTRNTAPCNSQKQSHLSEHKQHLHVAGSNSVKHAEKKKVKHQMRSDANTTNSFATSFASHPPGRSMRKIKLKPEYVDYLKTVKSEKLGASTDEDDDAGNDESVENNVKLVQLNEADNSVSHPVKRGRGRPRKHPLPQIDPASQRESIADEHQSTVTILESSQPIQEPEERQGSLTQNDKESKDEDDERGLDTKMNSGEKVVIKEELKEKYKDVLYLDSLDPAAGMWKNVTQVCPTALLTRARLNAKKFACPECLVIHPKGSTGVCDFIEPRHIYENPEPATNCSLQSVCSVPSPLCLRLSPQFNKLMVYSFSPIGKYTQFGPLVGILMTESDITVDVDLSHLWFLRYDEDGERYFLYTAEENASNWCRYLQTVFKDEYNVMLVLKEDGIFFVSTRDIDPGEMIRVHVPYFGNRDRPLALEMDFSNCMTCHKEFASPLDFQKHFHIFHPYGLVKRKERCSICQKVFQSLREYEKHCKQVHAGQGGVKCDVCDQFFYQKHKLKQHKWNCHPPPEAAVDCPKCGKTFKNSFSLRNHIQNAHSTMTFTCTTCNKVFTKKMTLLRHMKLHTETFKFFCDQCNKGFYNAWNLKVHMAVHTDEKPFVCDISGCKRGFASKKIIKDHYRKEHSLAEHEMPAIYRRALVIDKKVPRQRRPYSNHRRPTPQSEETVEAESVVNNGETTLAADAEVICATPQDEFHIIQESGSGEVVMAEDIIAEGNIIDGDVVLDGGEVDGNIVTVMLEDDIMTEQVVKTDEHLEEQTPSSDQPTAYITLQIGDQEVLVPGGGGQVVIYQTEPEN